MQRSPRRAVYVYLRLVGASLAARLEYKVDFLVTTVLYMVLSGIDLLLVWALLTHFRTVGGWSLYEVALLYGLSAAGMGLYRTFAGELDYFQRYTVAGEFDGVLLRPWPSLFVVLTRNLDIWRIGWVVQGFAVVVVAGGALVRMGELAPWSLPYLLLLPFCGAGIFFALGLATAAVAFWFERIDELMVFAVYAPQNAANYPQSIYPHALRALFYSAIPVAFVNFVPVGTLLGKFALPWAPFAPPFVAALAVALAYRFWRFGEAHYRSTGT